MTDPSVIAALEAAVAAAPNSRPLRQHLTQLLLDAGRAGDAVTHAARLLQDEPGDAEALRLLTAATSKLSPAPPVAAPAPTPIQPIADEQEGKTNVVRLRVLEGGGDFESEIERPQVKLTDVAGMSEVKRRLDLAFLAPMRNPEMRKMYGKSLRGGLLLYGPPGCGKTFIARAVAGELGAAFIAIGLPDVLDMYIGQSEKNLHDIFENARRAAPCVLFIDEIDALGRKRSFMRHSAERNVVNQLLADMDSFGANNEGVFILAATNHPWDVDAALRRPGRLDRMLLVLPPDPPAREAILRASMDGRPAEGIDYPGLVKATENYSGADLVHLCESAAELAMSDALTSGAPRPISTNDFERALRETRPSTRAWFETARNYAQFANDGGMYDDLLAYMRKQKLA